MPYSLSRTSRWYGFHVCDVTVTVQGPHHRLLEVQSALGRLDNFTTISHVIDTHTNSEHTDYDCDETIDPVSETEHDSHTTHTYRL